MNKHYKLFVKYNLKRYSKVKVNIQKYNIKCNFNYKTTFKM